VVGGASTSLRDGSREALGLNFGKAGRATRVDPERLVAMKRKSMRAVIG